MPFNHAPILDVGIGEERGSVAKLTNASELAPRGYKTRKVV